MKLNKFLLEQCQPSRYIPANLLVFSILSRACFLPWDVDVKKCTISPTKSTTKLNAFILLSFFHLLHAIHFVITLVLSLVLPGKLVLDALPVHAGFAVFQSASIFLVYEYLYQQYHLVPSLLNKVNELAREWPTLPTQVKTMTMQRAFLGIYPFWVPGFMVLIALLTIAEPTWMLHLYYWYDQTGNLPSSAVDWIVYGAACVGLVVTITLADSFLVCLYLNLVSLEYLTAMAAKQENSLRFGSSTQRIREYIRQLRHYELVIHHYNLCNSTGFYYIKVVAMYGAILGTFAAVKFMGRSLTAGGVSLATSLGSALSFVSSFAKAATISDRMDHLKVKVLSVAAKSHQARLFERELRAVRNEGIRIGGFGSMERMSMLVFIDFCSTSVASLLISYSHI